MNPKEDYFNLVVECLNIDWQRLLAHRVSQHYSLQTTSVPWGKGLSRVVARRTPETKMPEV